MYIFKAAVIGAGAMGGSIAQVISYSGLPVVLKDVDQGALDAGMAKARSIYEERARKGKMSASQIEDKMALISPQLDYSGFDDVDFVIEAVPEQLALKQAVFKELDGILHPGAILASNTSALSISAMAAATERPSQVVGFHFFNPAHVMKLIEVIPGGESSEDTVESTVQFAKELRKIPVVVKECPGFLVNRLLSPYINEAIFALEQGAATTEEIDAAIVGAGMPMGPFTLADMIGLDVCYHAGETMAAAYGDRMEASHLIAKLVAAGRLGHKSGKGFYTYGDETGPTVAELIAEVQAETGVRGTRFTSDRLILPLINEAVHCAGEGIASLGDIGLAMQAGAGFAQGPLEMADARGLDTVLADLEAWERELGPRFTPAPLLREKVAAGELGQKTGRGFLEYT
ncbi:MAG TPA: 3-hydroxyacyl-CoA dehydrogenase [Chloroflexia bacterium]|nr:3-hydroxyacyl-CoA dehydrogenase [Chloroflexia bacterium]